MGGAGSGPRRKPKVVPAQASEPWTSDTLAREPPKPDLGAALRDAIRAATVDPEILHSLEVQMAPDHRAYQVDIGSAQERVSLEKLEAIVATDALKNFVGGLLERCLKKYNARANYRRIDILNAVKDELLGIVGMHYPGEAAQEPLARVLAAVQSEFGDLGETPGRIAYVNSLLRKVILERIAEPQAR